MLRIGQPSFAHGAFMGLGAYGSALCMMKLHLPFSMALLLTAVGVAFLAGLVGVLFLRVRGVYFVLLTFAFGEFIVLIFVQWVSLFGGNGGLSGVPAPEIFGYVISSSRGFFILTFIVAAFAYCVVRMIYRSNLGSVIDSLDKNEPLTQSLGIAVHQYRLLVFCISAFMASLAGSFYGEYLTILTPADYGFWVPVDLIMMNVVGGIAHPLGAILGAILLVPLPELLRDARQYHMLVYGVLLILFVIFLPTGLSGLYTSCRRGKNGEGS